MTTNLILNVIIAAEHLANASETPRPNLAKAAELARAGRFDTAAVRAAADDLRWAAIPGVPDGNWLLADALHQLAHDHGDLNEAVNLLRVYASRSTAFDLTTRLLRDGAALEIAIASPSLIGVDGPQVTPVGEKSS